MLLRSDSRAGCKLASGISPKAVESELCPSFSVCLNTAVGRVNGVARHGTRLGIWLTKEQANDLLNAPHPKALAGKRDRAVLALLIGCGLRRAELLRLNDEDSLSSV